MATRSERARDEFIEKLKRRQIVGSHETAQMVVKMLRDTAQQRKWGTAGELMALLKEFIKPVISAGTAESLVIGNVIRHVLWIIRDEYQEAEKGSRGEESNEQRTMGERTRSLHSILTAPSPSVEASGDNFSKRLDVKGPIMESIGVYMNEIEDIHEKIGDQALEHLHANEIVLTIGYSNTVMNFLSRAAGERQGLEVFVCEAAPHYQGHRLAVELAKTGCKATVVTDAAVFALMSRVNKVILGAHAVMANGGVFATAGSRAVAQAAKHHSVPVVVCTGMFKLSPLYPSNLDHLIRLECPANILPFSAETTHLGNVHAHSPAFDYIPPELTTLYITNEGGHSPWYIYRLLGDFYDPEDYNLDNV
eukprot:TRINITY_DN19932_c0_g1_i3.p1 TRINITY_DN19932_c0_g1~~TRINITY_DN19932_c0_g1_i3.p1  ORF type:complete len:364 (+),score=70.89 TRINITY_DN19932_c0_g1_i3:240-1331(+)